MYLKTIRIIIFQNITSFQIEYWHFSHFRV